MSRSTKSSRVITRRARCRQVLVILNNRIEMVDLIREQIHPAVGDFAEGPLEFAVVRWHGLEVLVPLECVMFLGRLPPEPQWIQGARAKLEKELVSSFHSSAKTANRAQCDEDRTSTRVARKHGRRTKRK